MSRMLAVAVATPLLIGAVSCGQESQDSGEGSGGSCPLTLVYQSHTFYPYQTEKPVESGRPLGGVRYPPCDDGGGGQVDSNGHVTHELASNDGTAVPARAYTITGVDPAVAFVVPSSYRHTLFFPGRYGTEMPPEVERLLTR
jgi:hypothetical protein